MYHWHVTGAQALASAVESILVGSYAVHLQALKCMRVRNVTTWLRLFYTHEKTVHSWDN